MEIRITNPAAFQSDALANSGGRAAQLMAAGVLVGNTLHLPNGDPPRVAILPPPSGLGDLVAAIAQPIAKGIDALAGTKLAECGGCKQRQAALNRIIPKI